MSTMTDTTERDKMLASLTSLLKQAESTDPDDALTTESPLSLEVSGKYVHVLFSWGGPSTEFLAEFEDEQDAEYWFENPPRGGWFTRMDWGTREDVWVGSDDAERIMFAITRNPDELGEGSDES